MKAWTLTTHRDPRSSLEIQEHPTPEPKFNEVRIHCEASGLNFADVMAVKGLYREAPPLPSILGYEVVGRVETVGDGVPRSLIGERVVAMTRFGGYAEYAITDHRAIAVIPDEMSAGEAAAMATQGCTAWYAARILCPLRKGQRVLVHSAAGGVGHLLVQLALHSGCEVYAIASGEHKAAFLRTLGVQHIIDRNGDVEVELQRLLSGNRIDVSFNAVGGSSFSKDMRALAHGGRIVLFGGAERGKIGFLGTLRFVWRMGLVVPIFLMMKSKSILGVNMLRIAEHHPDIIAECLQSMVQSQTRGELKAHVHREFKASELPAALIALGSGSTIGKVVTRW